jgi:hypothetical protein
MSIRDRDEIGLRASHCGSCRRSHTDNNARDGDRYSVAKDRRAVSLCRICWPQDVAACLVHGGESVGRASVGRVAVSEAVLNHIMIGTAVLALIRGIFGAP